ncbi:dihydrodipicolinate synthase family protein [Acuticoccus yangtzensis]|uniref:dihydrodipicolinate synthase family protein n=1 Tax=Acuticoccus yangtzensis TaxID=1443441 RepID=UPI000A762314|nr:dihydrodipicolinate synthase family protein [Acuticoccus yangtzensis]
MAHRLTEEARGVFIISATPFLDDGAIDHASIDRLTDFYLSTGVDGITILGMMGEAPKLTGAESEAVLKQVLRRVDGRVPVVVGVSQAGFDNMFALARTAMDEGAAGVMVAPNAAAKTESNVISMFESIGKSLGDTPIVYQDFPLTTNMPISPGGFVTLAEAVPTVVMLKHEDWPGLPKLTTIRQTSEKRGTRRVSILCGNGGLYLPQELGRGADGAMTGFAYPEMLVEVVRRHHAGDVDGAEDVFDAYLPLVRHEQQPGYGLAVRKEILRRRGIITSAATRAPGPKLDPFGHQELTRLMDRLSRRLDGRMATAAQ